MLLDFDVMGCILLVLNAKLIFFVLFLLQKCLFFFFSLLWYFRKPHLQVELSLTCFCCFFILLILSYLLIGCMLFMHTI